MNKRRLHHLLTQLRKVRILYFVVAIAVSLAISVMALRSNNLEAIKLRDAVVQADQSNGDVEAALRTLREYTYSHMHSGLASPKPPVQLKYHYERLLAAEKERTNAVNAKLYTQAQAHCESLIPTGRSASRIDCIQDYVTTRGAATEQAIPDYLYKFDFVAPLWSPDLAGWSLVLTAVLVLALMLRTSVLVWLKHQLKQRL